MTDDLINRARFVVQLFQECDAIQLPHRPTEEVLLGMIDRIEELEAKLTQQDDLVQAAVAAKLKEVAMRVDAGRHLGTNSLGHAKIVPLCGDDILALITEGAQAALDRTIAAVIRKGGE